MGIFKSILSRKSDILKHLFTATLGVFGTLAVNHLDRRVDEMEHTANKQVYIEYHLNKSDHKVTICTMEYNLFNNIRHITGINYYNDGREFRRFHSNKIMVDDKQVQYFQTSFKTADIYAHIGGNGTIYLDSDGVNPDMGYFTVDGEQIISVKYFSLDEMQRIVSYKPDLNDPESIKEFILRINTSNKIIPEKQEILTSAIEINTML